jgi:hypothetical protein
MKGVFAPLALALAPALASAQTPAGGEFQVNTFTTGYQYAASVSPAAGGGFVVTWSSYGSFGDDLDSQSIQAQRYDAGGAPLGGRLQVNTYTASKQQYPDVASRADGGFVVVWESLGSPGGDMSGYSIQGRRYGAAGAPDGAQFQVNSYATGSQRRPVIARSAAGDFVVVWASQGSPGTDTSGYSIQGQRYDANGGPAGAQFEVNTYTTGLQLSPSVARGPDGGALVVWQSQGSPGTDASGTSIQARRYASDGSPQGAQLQINTWTTGNQTYPAAARVGDGFIVAWTSAGSFGDDLAGTSIQGQRLDADGAAMGAQFQVNDYTANDQQRPAVTATGGGEFAVVWESRGSPGTDTSSWSIQGRHFAADASPLGAQLQVNTDIAYGQIEADIATHAPGAFVVVWQGYGNPGVEGSDIHGQRYTVPVANEVPALSLPLAAAAGVLMLAAGRARRRRA